MKEIQFDELQSLVGTELGASAWRVVDQATIHAFADATQDHQWIHVDVARAQQELGGAIAHGFLTVSLLAPMSAEIFRVAGASRGLNYGMDRLRFTAAVPSGCRVRLREVLAATEPRGAGISYTTSCVVELEGQDRPALVCDWIRVVFR